MGLSTADCRKFLATNPGVLKLVRDRVGYDPSPAAWLAQCDGDAQEVAFFQGWLNNAANPKKWKRRAKYGIGSKTDREGGNSGGGCDYGEGDYVRQSHGVDPAGGVVREFWLEDTDHITLALLEKNGALTVIDDLSD